MKRWLAIDISGDRQKAYLGSDLLFQSREEALQHSYYAVSVELKDIEQRKQAGGGTDA